MVQLKRVIIRSEIEWARIVMNSLIQVFHIPHSFKVPEECVSKVVVS